MNPYYTITQTEDGKFDACHYGCLIGVFDSRAEAEAFLKKQDTKDNQFAQENGIEHKPQ